MNLSEEKKLKKQIEQNEELGNISHNSSGFVMPEIQNIKQTIKKDDQIDIMNNTSINMPDVQKIEEPLMEQSKINLENTIEKNPDFKTAPVQKIEGLNKNYQVDSNIIENDAQDSYPINDDFSNITNFSMSNLSNESNLNSNTEIQNKNKNKYQDIVEIVDLKENANSGSIKINDVNNKTNDKSLNNIETINLTNDNNFYDINNDKEQIVLPLEDNDNRLTSTEIIDIDNSVINNNKSNEEKTNEISTQTAMPKTQDIELSTGNRQAAHQNIAASSYGGGIFIDYAYLDESIKLIGRELISDCQSINRLYSEYNKISLKDLDIECDKEYFNDIKKSLDEMFKNTNDEKTEFKTLKKKLENLQDECKRTDSDYEIKFEMQYVNNFFVDFGDDLTDTEKALIFEEYSKHITETINGQENKQAYMNKIGYNNLKIGANYLTTDEYLQMLSQISDSYKYQAVVQVVSKSQSERTAAENQALDKWFSAVENIANDELSAVQLLTKSMLAQDKALGFVDDAGSVTDAEKYSYYFELSQSAQEGFVVKFQLGADSVDSYRISAKEDGGCELFVTINGVEQLINDENKPVAVENLNEIKDFLVFRLQAKCNNQANFYAKEAQKIQQERDKINGEIKDKTTFMTEDAWGVPIEATKPDTPEVIELRKQVAELEKKLSLYSNYCLSFQEKSFEINKMYSDYKELSSKCSIQSYDIKYINSNTPNGIGHTEVIFYSDKEKTQPIKVSEEQIAIFLAKENLSVEDLMITGAPLRGYDLNDIKAFQKAGTDKLTILNYIENKYGVESSDYYTKYVKDIGNRIIGKEMAQHRIDVLNDIDSDFVDGLYVTLIGTGDGLVQFAQGIGNLFGADGEVSSREYMTMNFSEYLMTNYSVGAVMVGAYEISTSIGNMLPSIALNFVPGVGQILSLLSVGLSCAGNAREEGLQMGMNNSQAWTYGIVSGSLEACLQFFLGGIKPLQKGGSQLMENGLKNVFIDMAKEAREEMLQEVLNPIYLNMIMNWDWNNEESFLNNALKIFEDAYEGAQNIDMQQVMKAGIYAVITAGVMNSPSTIRSVSSMITTGNSITYAYLMQKYRGQDLSLEEIGYNLRHDIDVIANNDIKISQLMESLKSNPEFEAKFNSYNEQASEKILFDEYALITAIETILTVNKPLINSTETATNINDAIVQGTIDILNSQLEELTRYKNICEEMIKINEGLIEDTEIDNKTRIDAETQNINLKEKVNKINNEIEALNKELNQPTIKSTSITETQVAFALTNLLFNVSENQGNGTKNAFTKLKEFFINKSGNIEEQTISEGVDYTVYNVSELNSQKVEIENKINELENKGTQLTEEEKLTLEEHKSTLKRIEKVLELKNKLPKTNEEKTFDELIESRNEVQEEILAYEAVIKGFEEGDYSAYSESIDAYKKLYAPRIESLKTELQAIDNLIKTKYSEETAQYEIKNITEYDPNSIKEKLTNKKIELKNMVEELEKSLKSITDEQIIENINSELSSVREKINTIDEMLLDFNLFENTMSKVTSEINSNTVQEIIDSRLTVEEFNKKYHSKLTDEQFKLASRIKEITNLNELNVDRSTINEMFENLPYEGQQEIINSVLHRMISGENLSRETYSLIFNSSLFKANSEFSKNYLHDFIENGFGNIKGSKELADKVRNIYDSARQSTNTDEMKQLYSYCDHTEAHVLQVAFLTVNVLPKVNLATNTKSEIKISEEQFVEMFYAGLFHDLGMAAGSFDINGNPMNLGVNMIANYSELENGSYTLSPEIINSKLYKDLAKFVRENHTLNSAIAILSNRSLIESIGLNADRLALLCFSHSKSNSGVGKLDSTSDWSYSIQKINSAVSEVNKILAKTNGAEIRFDTTSFGNLTNNKVQTMSGQKFANVGGEKKINVDEFRFMDGVIDLLSVEGLSLRIGDAYVSKASIKLPEQSVVRWVHNGVEYSADTLVLTQTGAYMAYDSRAAQLYQDMNNCDTEVSDVGAFAFFEINENGQIVPWKGLGNNSSINDQVNENGAFTNPNIMFNEPLTEKINISLEGKIIKTKAYRTSKGYYYTENNTTKEKQYYKYNEDTKVYEPMTEKITESEAGKLLYTSTGKFLVGENNVSYWLEVKDGKLVSKYYITDMSIYPFNTISKGIDERLGEIRTASSSVERLVDIVIEEEQFKNSFKKVRVGDETIYVATQDIADIYINELRRCGGDTNFMSINGINFSQFRTSQEMVKTDMENINQLLEKVSSRKDQFVLSTNGSDIFYDSVTNTINIPNSYFNESLINEIFSSIPTDIKKLSIPNKLFGSNYNILEKFSDLETLSLNSFGGLSAENIKYLKEHTNIKELIINDVMPYNMSDIAKYEDTIFIENNKKNYAISGDLIIRYKDSLFFSSGVKVLGNTFSLKSLDIVLTSLNNNFEKIEFNCEETKYSIVKSDNKVNITIHDQNMNISKELYDYFKSKGMDVENISIEIYGINRLKEIKCLDYDYSILEQLSKDVNITFVTSASTMFGQVSYNNFTSLCESMKWYRKIITDYDLSPVEKLTVGYDILKTFEYKESENKLDSRRPDRIIQTGNIVCSGYSNMLKEIFKELDPNIQIEDMSLTCYDTDDTTVLGKHSRTYALIDDAKYNIHGLFALDPTWDSYKTNGKEVLGDDYTALDLYDYFLVPFTEYGSVFQHDSPLSFFEKNNSDLNQNSIDAKKIQELYEKTKGLSDKEYKKLFSDTGVMDILKTDREKLKYFCAPKISTDVMMEIIKNARLAEGYTQENIAHEMEKVKRIYTRKKQQVDSLTGKMDGDTNKSSKIDIEIVKVQQAIKENRIPETINIDSVKDLTQEHLEILKNISTKEGEITFKVADRNNKVISLEEIFIENSKTSENSKKVQESINSDVQEFVDFGNPNVEERKLVAKKINESIETILSSSSDVDVKFEQIKNILLSYAHETNINVNDLLTSDIYNKIIELYGSTVDLETFKKIINVLSDINTSNLKKQILSKITPNMTEFERARLIYLELGKAVNYDEQFKYYMKSNLTTEADSIYYEVKQIKDLEKNNKIICVHWAQLYSEMLQDAGISSDRIFIQRLIDPTTGKYVYGSHAGIYVKLDDGSFIMPDITIPLGKASDLYNVKIGNPTTGFIYFSKEDVMEIINLEKTNPAEFGTGYELKNMHSIGNESQILDYDELFLRHNGKMLFGMEIRPDIEGIDKTLRLSRETEFYDKYKEAHSEYVRSMDSLLSKKVSNLSDMSIIRRRINNVIERYNISKNGKASQINYLGIENGHLTSRLFGLNTINSDSMIDIKAYISEMTEIHRDKLNFDIENSIFFRDNKTTIGLITVNDDAILSYICELDETGKIVIRPDLDLGVEMILGNKKLTDIEKNEKINKLMSSMTTEFI